MYDILLKSIWWVLSNTSLIIWICPAIYEILANEAFIVTNSLISWLFVITYICADSLYLEFSSVTWFVKICLLVVEIQAEWSL